jgi:hypothetical protein
VTTASGRRAWIAAALVASVAAAFLLGRRAVRSGLYVRVDHFARCDGRADATAGVQRALAAAAGKTLLVPSGCKLLLATPGAGNAAVTIPNRTRIFCADHSAGFSLARRRCSSGRYARAACTTDADCNFCSDGGCAGATCGYDAGSSEFAPAAGATYTVLRSVANETLLNSVTDIAIDGCSIFVNGADEYGRCVGGTNDGRPCLHVCNGERGQTCDDDADCSAFGHGTCQNLADCKAAASPGECVGEPGKPSGAGHITPIDFGSVNLPKGFVGVRDVWIYDHRQGDDAIIVGSANAEVIAVDNRKEIFAPYPNGLGVAPTIGPTYAALSGVRASGALRLGRSNIRARLFGVQAAGASSDVSGNTISATDAESGIGVSIRGANGNVLNNTVDAGLRGIDASGSGTTVSGNVVTGTGPSTVGLYVGGAQVKMLANQVGAYTCVKGDPLTAINVTVAANRCFSGSGPKIVIQGAGWQVEGNYLAWGTSAGPIISIGSTDTVAAGAGHPMILGNLIHTDQPTVTMIGLADVGKRCNGGSRRGEVCTSSTTTQCPGATCGTCCNRTRFGEVVIASNSFLFGGTAIDLSTLTSGDTTIAGLKISDNYIGEQVGSGFKFPPNTALLTGTMVSANEFRGSGAFLTNWSWRFGRQQGNAGLGPTDDDPQIIVLTQTGADAVPPGDAVEIDATADNAFRQARPGSTNAIGIVLDAPGLDRSGLIAIRGTTTCNTADVTIRRGDRLGMSATAGKLAVVSGTDATIARALSARDGGAGPAAVRCLVDPTPARNGPGAKPGPSPPRRAPR